VAVWTRIWRNTLTAYLEIVHDATEATCLMAKNNDNWSGRVLLSCVFELRVDAEEGLATQQDAQAAAIERLEYALHAAVAQTRKMGACEDMHDWGDIEVEEVESDAVDRA